MPCIVEFLMQRELAMISDRGSATQATCTVTNSDIVRDVLQQRQPGQCRQEEISKAAYMLQNARAEWEANQAHRRDQIKAQRRAFDEDEIDCLGKGKGKG